MGMAMSNVDEDGLKQKQIPAVRKKAKKGNFSFIE